MSFLKSSLKQFDAVTRARGEDLHKSDLVKLERIAPQAARFEIFPDRIRVFLDWADLEKEGLRTYCTCDAFLSELCPHLWSSLSLSEESNQRELLQARQRIEKRRKIEIKRLTIDSIPELMKDSYDIEAAKTWPINEAKPIAIGTFSERGPGEWEFEPIFLYSDFRIRPQTIEDEILLDIPRSTRVRRDMKAERKWLKTFKGDYTLRKATAEPLALGQMQDLSEILMKDGWKVEVNGKPLSRFSKFSGVLTERADETIFAAVFDFEGEKISLRTLFDTTRLNGVIELKNETSAFVPEEWAKRIDVLGRSSSFSPEGHMILPRSSLPLLKPLFDDIPELVLGNTVKHAFTGLEKLTQSGQAQKPAALQAELRSYQAEGLHWLERIAASGFGGILADDMGLGKTIQIISYLLRRSSLPSEARKPSLVVLPKSLVFNWLGEVEKFAPRLRVLDFAGASRGFLKAENYDVVLTTYHVMKNEIDRLEKVEFDSIILDEAQAIKNSSSQLAKAVCRLKGKHRFALSGTPIENSLGDLFSLMQFVNPGLIPAPLVSSATQGRLGDMSKESLKRLSIAVKPFVLRRTKKNVLKELPDKCEQTFLCELEGPQKKLYDRLRKQYRDSIKKTASEGEKKKTHIQIFEALLRLRQAACHPGLLDPEKSREMSAKFDVLIEHLEEIRATGNKALVFSQFTSLLALLKPRLEQAGFKFEYLDGQTRNRGAVVEKFVNNPDTTVFLISLKAGGTGLNLTCASYVFLLDPWWNPAAESQAIDRAYRMGQKQKVMAYRLIAKGTIEEKIMKLQKQKRALADSVINDDPSFLRSLSVKDLESLFDA